MKDIFTDHNGRLKSNDFLFFICLSAEKVFRAKQFPNICMGCAVGVRVPVILPAKLTAHQENRWVSYFWTII